MKKKIRWIVGGAILLMMFLYIMNHPYPYPEYNGERIRGADQFTLNFTAMNGEQTHTMFLQAGDTLHCAWQISQGEADVVISIAETKIYQGNKIDTAEFDLMISEGGECVISVKGQHAAGWISIGCRAARRDEEDS